MSRLMSVAMTTDAVIERRKTVTRRVGWWLNAHRRHVIATGDTLTLCRKVQGRLPGEPIVRLAEVEVVKVEREPLRWLSSLSPGYRPDWAAREMELEGFPGLPSDEFLTRYFIEAQRMTVDQFVTRIEWRYLDHEAPTPGRVWTDNVRHPGGGTTIHAKRCCNGCGRRLGDTLVSELDAAVCGFQLPDVRDECGCTREGVPV